MTLDLLFKDPKAVEKLQYLYKQKEGELVDSYNLDSLMSKLKDMNLIGFLSDYCGYSRCFITKLALSEMKKRGLVDKDAS